MASFHFLYRHFVNALTTISHFTMTASSHLALISGLQAVLGPVVLQLSGLRSSLSVITGLATATGG